MKSIARLALLVAATFSVANLAAADEIRRSAEDTERQRRIEAEAPKTPVVQASGVMICPQGQSTGCVEYPDIDDCTAWKTANPTSTDVCWMPM